MQWETPIRSYNAVAREAIETFFMDFQVKVTLNKVKPENICNCDETGEQQSNGIGKMKVFASAKNET